MSYCLGFPVRVRYRDHYEPSVELLHRLNDYAASQPTVPKQSPSAALLFPLT